MVLARNELLLLKNFTIRMEYVHSITLGRFKPDPKYDADGNITNKDDPFQMELCIMYFTPTGIQRFKIHADTELELLVAYGEVLIQMGVGQEEILTVHYALTNELHPDGIGRAVGPEDMIESTMRPISTLSGSGTPQAE